MTETCFLFLIYPYWNVKGVPNCDIGLHIFVSNLSILECKIERIIDGFVRFSRF